MASDKFTNHDRSLVVRELEKVQNTKLSPVKPSRKLFVDTNHNYYCIFGAKEDWHGIQISLVNKLESNADKTVLVICKKYQTRIDICVGVISKLILNKDKLVLTKSNNLQFHTVLT